MKLIKHMIFVDIHDDKKLLINSLTGTMDEIDAPIYETLSKWQACEEIVTENDLEAELLSNLQSRGYLVNSHEEEVGIKNEILKVLRNQHLQRQKDQRAITFVMTYNCNFRCPYCFEGEAYIKKEIITPEQIDAALKLAGEGVKEICVFGGEPLLPKTRPVLEYLFNKAPDKTYQIFTNGYYLTEFLDLLLTINISQVLITLDGSEETHNSRRVLANGKPTFKKIIDGVEKCLESGINIRIRMNLDKSNYEGGINLREELLERFSGYKDNLSFELTTLIGDSQKERIDILTEIYHSDITYSYEDREKINDFITKKNSLLDHLVYGRKVNPLYSYCYAHVDGMVFDPYGVIYPCLGCVGKEHFSIGKYHPFIELKENSIHNRNIEKISECRDCTYSLLCGGGCPLKLADSDDFFKPVCYSVKTLLHNELPIFYKEREEAMKKVEETVNNAV
ncbi:radical SAM/SPASM domain-containing protein [Alkaliphilus transvaalensis]|uniref:radical SAM/SPASM domain-containing protein n=1 Tax=Alkaliphilus transvaalensis TaxID=114628 RepID=UPI00047BBD7B|nr:radical SAM protein [Alkaliphilus transvaalensis]